jgi:hypothetical protein
MRLAGVAAERGHDVTLLEGADELGGHLNRLKELPGRSRWRQAVADLEQMVTSRSVDVQHGERVEAGSLDPEWCDVVICACGARWDRSGYSARRPERAEGIPGAQKDNVLDVGTAVERALLDASSLGPKVLILDETGDYLPMGLAELLADSGVHVDIVTPALIVGGEFQKTGELTVLMPSLIKKGVRLRTRTFVESIEDDGVSLYDLWDGEVTELAPTTVVLSQRRLPRDALFRELTASDEFEEVRRVGDALSPRRLDAVMYEAEKVGREI